LYRGTRSLDFFIYIGGQTHSFFGERLSSQAVKHPKNIAAAWTLVPLGEIHKYLALRETG